jgi:arginase
MRSIAWEMIGVPYTSARRPGGIADAIAVLRAAGVAERLADAGVVDGGDLELPGPSGERGASGLLNEEALAALTHGVRAAVGRVRDEQRLPLLVGGDCPIVFGALAAIRDAGERPGLLLIDGHEDAWPPARSPTGEASDSEVAIALGLLDAPPAPLAALLPMIEGSGLAVLGARDASQVAAAGLESVREQAAFFADSEDLGSAEPGALVSEGLAAVDADGVWVHVDLDVLATESFRAADYLQPGGIDWEHLGGLVSTAVADPRCRGLSVVIYNPDLDPDRRDARRISEFLEGLARVGASPRRGTA